MAHVIHSINITVDGSCHHTDVVADAEHHSYALNMLRSSSALLFGRNTFDLFASFWRDAATNGDLPSYMTDFAIELNAKTKYVVSNRCPSVDWINTQWLPAPQLKEYISSAPGVVVVFGSPGLGTSLASAGLVDETHVVIQPLIGACSVRAFEGLNVRKNLKLLEARPFRSGVVLLRYASKT